MTNQTVIKNAIKNKMITKFFSIAEKFFGSQTRELSVRSYFDKAEKNSFIYAYALLNGNCYESVKKGGRVLQKSARKKDAEAILLLARNYYYGYGVKKSQKKAFKTWEKGAKLGFSEANYYLGLCFAKGIFVNVNVKKAEKYLKIAKNKGFCFAKTALDDLKFINE
ncbi:MAG: sel1 repeat family protein [Clostridia bacterium]|nr:sel1 repeat family protein [Clostridia bacterium]